MTHSAWAIRAGAKYRDFSRIHIYMYVPRIHGSFENWSIELKSRLGVCDQSKHEHTTEDLWDANSWHDISRLILTLISLLSSQSLLIHSLHFHDSKNIFDIFHPCGIQVRRKFEYLPSDAVLESLWCCQYLERGSARRYWWGWSAHLALPWCLWTCDNSAAPRMINLSVSETTNKTQ